MKIELLFIFVFCFSACFSNKDTSNNDYQSKNLKENLLGDWVYILAKNKFTLTLNADGTFKEYSNNMAMDPNVWFGNYIIEGDEIVFHHEGSFCDGLVVEFTFNQFNDILEFSKGDNKKVYSKNSD